MAKKNQTELVLTVLCVIADRGDTLSTSDIAELCGCSKRNISETINRALNKLRVSKLKEWR